MPIKEYKNSKGKKLYSVYVSAVVHKKRMQLTRTAVCSKMAALKVEFEFKEKLSNLKKELPTPTWDEWFSHPEWAAPIRHTEANYYHPLFAGQEYSSTIETTNFGKSSITFTMTIRSNNQVMAQASSTHVFIDKKSMEKINIPEQLMTKLKTPELITPE